MKLKHLKRIDFFINANISKFYKVKLFTGYSTTDISNNHTPKGKLRLIEFLFL